jgi:hypothetical protein
MKQATSTYNADKWQPVNAAVFRVTMQERVVMMLTIGMVP